MCDSGMLTGWVGCGGETLTCAYEGVAAVGSRLVETKEVVHRVGRLAANDRVGLEKQNAACDGNGVSDRLGRRHRAKRGGLARAKRVAD